MADAIIFHVHGMVTLLAHHIKARSFLPADDITEDIPSTMIKCADPNDRHVWIEWDPKTHSGKAIAFYVVECRDGKKRRLRMELNVVNGMKDSFRLNEYNVRKADDWGPDIQKFADWIESTTDYDIE
jgi:hypothetical protein